MAAVWMRFRSELRSRAGAVLSLAVIVGLLGGVVIAAAAGARRTETAYPRFLEAERGMDLVVNPYGRDRTRAIEAIKQLPDVAEVSSVNFVAASARSSGRTLAFPNVFPLVALDGRFGVTFNRLKVLSGRAADPRRPGEAVASLPVAQRLGIAAGGRITLTIARGGLFGPGPPGPVAPIHLTVVGVAVAPGEFEPLAGGFLPALHLTPGFYREHARLFDPTSAALAVRLRDGAAGVPAFKRELRGLRTTLHVGYDFPFDQGEQTAGVQQATRVQAIALAALAALVGVAGLAIFAQSLARQTYLESREYPTLRALGLAPRQLLGVGLLRAGAIAVVGAAIAVGFGIVLSSLTPTGVARIAEPDPGIAVDLPVVAAGVLGIVVLVVVLGALPSWRAARTAASADPSAIAAARRPSAVAAWLARTGRAPTTVTGVRMALEPGRGRTAVPVRSTLLGTALGLLAVSAAMSFGASLDHLATTPRLSGWNWDTVMGTDINNQLSRSEGVAARRVLVRTLRRDDRVQGFAIGDLPSVQIEGMTVPGMAMEPRKGSVEPSLADGRLPATTTEVALGGQTMRSAGVAIGDAVRVRFGGTVATMRVVGRIAMPSFFFNFGSPGKGAVVTWDWLLQADPREAGRGGAFVRYAPGTDARAFEAGLRRRVPAFFALPRLVSQQVSNLTGVQRVPLALAGVLGLLALATLVHTLVTSIRRRRHDLAILKTIGFSRRQVSSTVAWQATTFAVVALAAGLPLGAAAGRWGWNALADRLGVVPEAVVPIVAVLLIVPATVAAANLVAAVPGWIAARTRPAEVLRSE
jgi:FtsX-like permease family/MacB-like periplasmic core domain